MSPTIVIGGSSHIILSSVFRIRVAKNWWFLAEVGGFWPKLVVLAEIGGL